MKQLKVLCLFALCFTLVAFAQDAAPKSSASPRTSLTADAQAAKVNKETAESLNWRTKLLAAHASKAGCSEAVYPSAIWKEVSCGTPTKVAKTVADDLPVVRPLDEATTGDYVLQS